MRSAAIKSDLSTRPKRRRWKPKQLDVAQDDSREFLIWSMYHNSWHCRSSTGGAAGYTSDILKAGIFETRKAREYHDGVRNRAIHVTKAYKRFALAMNSSRAEMQRIEDQARLFQQGINAAKHVGEPKS